jgi:hypothetical protein
MQKAKYFIVILFFTLSLPNLSAQESQTTNENWLKQRFDQRIYLGFYDSFGEEKANVLQAGYEAVLNLLYITPVWSLMDVSLGMDILMVRDQIETESHDRFGHIRHTDNRFIPGFEFNWGVRLYSPPIPRIKTSFYLEGQLITLVIYTQPYPDSGTHVNIGTHVGFGFKFPINELLNCYTTIRLFSHTSNGQPEETNPALDFVGIIFGLQF